MLASCSLSATIRRWSEFFISDAEEPVARIAEAGDDVAVIVEMAIDGGGVAAVAGQQVGVGRALETLGKVVRGQGGLLDVALGPSFADELGLGSLDLDVVVDDRPENCLDVALDSSGDPTVAYLTCPAGPHVTDCFAADTYFDGGAERIVGKALAGSLVPAGTLLKRTSKVLAGSLAPTGALLKRAQKVLAGAITPTPQHVDQVAAGFTTATTWAAAPAGGGAALPTRRWESPGVPGAARWPRNHRTPRRCCTPANRARGPAEARLGCWSRPPWGCRQDRGPRQVL